VLGIPRGGILIVSKIAGLLNGELSVVIAKKLSYPRPLELAVGAVAENGYLFLTDLSKDIEKRL
jgi:predicted phosphoribosyltransferase